MAATLESGRVYWSDENPAPKQYWTRLQKGGFPRGRGPRVAHGLAFVSIDSPIGQVVRIEGAGDHLTVLSAPWSDFRRLSLHFDDASVPGYPIRPGVSFDHPFQRFFVSMEPIPPSSSFTRAQYGGTEEWIRFYIGIGGARATFHSDSHAFNVSHEPRRLRIDAGSSFFLLPPVDGGFARSLPDPSIAQTQIGYRAFSLVNRGPGDLTISDSRDVLAAPEQMVLEPGDALDVNTNDFQGNRSLSAQALTAPVVADLYRLQ